MYFCLSSLFSFQTMHREFWVLLLACSQSQKKKKKRNVPLLISANLLIQGLLKAHKKTSLILRWTTWEPPGGGQQCWSHVWYFSLIRIRYIISTFQVFAIKQIFVLVLICWLFLLEFVTSCYKRGRNTMTDSQDLLVIDFGGHLSWRWGDPHHRGGPCRLIAGEMKGESHLHDYTKWAFKNNREAEDQWTTEVTVKWCYCWREKKNQNKVIVQRNQQSDSCSSALPTARDCYCICYCFWGIACHVWAWK